MAAEGTKIELANGKTTVRRGIKVEGGWAYIYSDLTTTIDMHYRCICLHDCTLTIPTGVLVSWEELAGDGVIVQNGERMIVRDGEIIN